MTQPRALSFPDTIKRFVHAVDNALASRAFERMLKGQLDDKKNRSNKKQTLKAIEGHRRLVNIHWGEAWTYGWSAARQLEANEMDTSGIFQVLHRSHHFTLPVEDIWEPIKINLQRMQLRLRVREMSPVYSSATAPDQANTAKLFPKGIPENTNIIDLVVRLDAARGSGKTEIDIAREFMQGNESKAKSLLSQIRRMKRKGRLAK